MFSTIRGQSNQHVYIPNSIDFYSTIVYNDYMNNRMINIEEGDIMSEGYLSKYKLYKVQTKKNDAQEFDSEVSRRFSDFEWLYQELINKYGGYIIPSLPEKHVLTKINLESYDFSERRRKDLQTFLQKLLNHKQIRYVPELRIFIEDREKFISLLKGELVQNKTFEQKYENIKSSMFGFFQTQTPTAIQNFTQRITDLVRTLDNSDKDLNNSETLLTNLSMKADKLKKLTVEHIQSIKDQAKQLTDQQDHLISWGLIIFYLFISKDGLGSRVDKTDFDNFNQLVRYNNMKAKHLYRQSQDWENQFTIPLQHWLVDTDAALQACERRRNLIKELVIDQQRIEELKLTYSEQNSRRDIEMDLLKTKYQKNKDKSDRMSHIMTDEIGNYTNEAKEKLKELFLAFRKINCNNGRDFMDTKASKEQEQDSPT